MSGLQKKSVRVDQTLAALLGVQLGSMVSYAEIQKGLHAYIRKNNLTGGGSAVTQQTAQEPAQPQMAVAPSEAAVSCPNCGSSLPSTATFCDQCGTSLR